MVRERRWLVHSLLRVPKPQHTGRTCASRLGQTTLSSRQSSTGCSPISFPVVFRGGFSGRRERGTFAIRIPAAAADRDVVWTLSHAGHSYSIPGRVTSPAYELSLEPYSAGSLAPELQFQEDGTTSTGREGVYGDAVTVSGRRGATHFTLGPRSGRASERQAVPSCGHVAKAPGASGGRLRRRLSGGPGTGRGRVRIPYDCHVP